jgi:hypothetical protein
LNLKGSGPEFKRKRARNLISFPSPASSRKNEIGMENRPGCIPFGSLRIIKSKLKIFLDDKEKLARLPSNHKITLDYTSHDIEQYIHVCNLTQ